MSEKGKEIDVLDELNKAACMGKDAIHFISDKVDNKDLKKELDNQYNKYKKLSNKIWKLYPQYSSDQPHKTSTLNKVMTWYGIEMKTMINNSTTKIVELLLQGTNTGIIEGRKLLNHKNTDKKVQKLIQEFVDMQENAVEQLKKFL